MTYVKKSAVVDHLKESIAPVRAPPSGITASDLQKKQFRPVSWVVNDIIPDGLTMLAGKPKIGKSWMVLGVAVAVAQGGYTLGNRKCVEGDVLYAALEDNERRLKARMSKVCHKSEWPPRLTFWTSMSRLEEGGLDEIRAWIKNAENPRLVIIDVFTKVRRAKSNNEGIYDADYLAAGPLKALADEAGVAFLIVHHLRKMAADGDPLDMVSGSTGLTGAMDTILVLNREPSGVTLYGRGRDIEELEVALEFEKDVCHWRVLGEASEVRMSAERRAVLDALRAEGEAMTPKMIADVTGRPGGTTRRLLHSMVFDGEVKKAGRGKYILPDISPPNIGNKVTNECLG